MKISKTRRRIFTFFFTIIAFISFKNNSFASSIPIVNPSFESNLASTGSWNFSIDGWSYTGVWSSYHPDATAYPNGVPDGVNVAASNYGTLSQTLTTALSNNTKYTMDVYIGHRADTPFSNYTIELLAGSNVIASVSDPIDPGAGNFGLATLVYTAGQNDTYAGQTLGIALVDSGYQVNFDNVSLNSTSTLPIPATIWLFGIAFPSLIGMSRRRLEL